MKFGPLALEVVRGQYVAAGYCRRLCNQMTSIVRQAFKYAASRELVSIDLYVRLTALTDLLEGKTTAPDHPRVKPAEESRVATTLPKLSPIVADMVRVQLLIGSRPGELVLMRGADIDRQWRTFDGVAVWLYEVPRHKTRWRGGYRAVAIGPKAQAILAPYLDRRGPEERGTRARLTRGAWRARRNGRESSRGHRDSCGTTREQEWRPIMAERMRRPCWGIARRRRLRFMPSGRNGRGE